MEKKACVWIVVALFCSWRAVQGELCACQNGGVCVDGGPACECPEGYGGDLCDGTCAAAPLFSLLLSISQAVVAYCPRLLLFIYFLDLDIVRDTG